MSHKADLIRLALLNELGGIWVDATVFCNKPLNTWLRPIIKENDFFVFEKPGGGRPVSSWLIYSKPHNYMVSRWLNASFNYISSDPLKGSGEYFWLHGLFADLAGKDEKFGAIWNKTTKLDAVGPHMIQHTNKMSEPLTSEMKSKIDKSDEPVFKLTWKMNQSLIIKNTTLHYLFKSHGIENGRLIAMSSDYSDNVNGSSVAAGRYLRTVSTAALSGYLHNLALFVVLGSILKQTASTFKYIVFKLGHA
eukprot:scaffold1559_cov176-Ochromonas_danica.AAC.10